MEWGGGGRAPLPAYNHCDIWTICDTHLFFYLPYIFGVSVASCQDSANPSNETHECCLNEVSVNNNNNYNDDDDDDADVHIHDDDDDDVNGDNDNNISYTRVIYEKINCSYYNHVT